jgi:hypothetical protein
MLLEKDLDAAVAIPTETAAFDLSDGFKICGMAAKLVGERRHFGRRNRRSPAFAELRHGRLL